MRMTTAAFAHTWRPQDTLGNRLRLVRGELGLSQSAAAEKAGITSRVWQNAEDGRSIRSERAVVLAIAMAFNLDREWLMFGGELKAENPHPEGPGGGESTDLLEEVHTPQNGHALSTRELTRVIPIFRDQPESPYAA